MAVGLETRLLIVAVDGAAVAVRKGLSEALRRGLEAEQLAHVRLRLQLLDPEVLDLLEIPLPGLVGGRQIREGDHLRVEPEARCDRLQHGRVLHIDEAELTWQVPDEILTPLALQLDLSQIIHRRKSFVGRHEVRRRQSRRGLRQEEAVVDPVGQLPSQPRDVRHRLMRHDVRHLLRPQGPDHVVDVNAHDLDRWGTVAARRHAVRHQAPVVRDGRVLESGIGLVDVVGDAQLAAEVRVHTGVGFLRVDGDDGRVAAVDEVREVLAVPSLARALAALGGQELGSDVGLGVLLDELPELVRVPRGQLRLDGVHLQLLSLFQLHLHAQHDAVEAK
mmetsp:Transcript_41524/g.131427  ORF Transcript_41524/g.131427 Transcript_41524/m.131427 type:complete len:333 (-) Transcript_41524:1058-2056(-)